MRINEDFIDELNVQDVITSDDEQLSFNYPYSFFFVTKPIQRNFTTENMWFQMMMKFCSMFTRMVKGLPFVMRFKSDNFRIYMGGSYLFKDPDGRGSGKHLYEPFIYYSYNTVELPGGFKLVFSDEYNVVTLDDYYHHQNSSLMNFGFFINIDANMENISRIQKMYVTLWQLFNKALSLSFDLWCQPDTICYYSEGLNIFQSNNGIPKISDNGPYGLNTWMCLRPNSFVILANTLKFYRPEISTEEATKQVDDFIAVEKQKHQ